MSEMETLTKYQSVFGNMIEKKNEESFLIEQYFNDRLCSWTLYLLSISIFMNLTYCVFRVFIEYFLDWDKIDG